MMSNKKHTKPVARPAVTPVDDDARIAALVGKAPRMAGLRNPRVKASLALQADQIESLQGIDEDHVTEAQAAKIAVVMYDMLEACIGPDFGPWIENIADEDQFPVMGALFGKLTDRLGKG